MAAEAGGYRESVFRRTIVSIPRDASDAVKAKVTEKVLRLLDGGEVDINVTDTCGCTLLFCACFKGLEYWGRTAKRVKGTDLTDIPIEWVSAT